MKLVYTEDAIQDLHRLREFIATYDPAAARRIALELLAKIELLLDFPHIGTPVETASTPESIRDMVFKDYVVRYSVHTSVIIILRVWHGLEDGR